MSAESELRELLDAAGCADADAAHRRGDSVGACRALRAHLRRLYGAASVHHLSYSRLGALERDFDREAAYACKPALRRQPARGLRGGK